jgi:hypothetical protein
MFDGRFRREPPRRAMVGGVIEYLSLVIGFRSLLLVTAALYGLAYALARSHMGANAEPANASHVRV